MYLLFYILSLLIAVLLYLILLLTTTVVAESNIPCLKLPATKSDQHHSRRQYLSAGKRHSNWHRPRTHWEVPVFCSLFFFFSFFLFFLPPFLFYFPPPHAHVCTHEMHEQVNSLLTNPLPRVRRNETFVFLSLQSFSDNISLPLSTGVRSWQVAMPSFRCWLGKFQHARALNLSISFSLVSSRAFDLSCACVARAVGDVTKIGLASCVKKGAQEGFLTCCSVTKMEVMSKEAVGNSWDILYIFMSQMSSESSKQSLFTKRINPTFATESEFYHICVLQCACVPFRHLIEI